MAGKPTSVSPKLAKSIDDFYKAKDEWHATVAKSYSQPSTTEREQPSRKEETTDKALAERFKREEAAIKARQEGRPTRFKRDETTDRSKDGGDKDPKMSEFANLSVGDGEPLASDEECFELSAFDKAYWLDKKSPDSTPEQIAKIREALGMPKEKATKR